MTPLILGTIAIVLAFNRRVFLALLVPSACYLLLEYRALQHWQIPPSAGYWLTVGAVTSAAIVFGVPAVRRQLITRFAAPWITRRIPYLSASEQALIAEPLEARSPLFDGGLVSGRPRWQTLLESYIHEPNDRERGFIRGPVNRVCSSIDDWMTYCDGELSRGVWEQVEQTGLLGLRIPRELGGQDLSAAATSAVIARLSSRSPALGWTITQALPFVELVSRFGTPAQKSRYLTGIARGEEIPCTLPAEALGEAAGYGTIERVQHHGRDVLGIRLNFENRTGPLAPLATVIAVCVPLFDPEALVGPHPELGLAWILVPTKHPMIEHGERHESVLRGYAEGPVHARDAIVPLDDVIGGQLMLGSGERLWNEASSVVEAIGLSSLVSGSAQLALRLARSEHLLRHVGDGEPLWPEPLARSAGRTYALRATRRLLAGSIDAGASIAGVAALAEERSMASWKQVIDGVLEVGVASGSRRGPSHPLSSSRDALPLGAARSGKPRIERLRDAYASAVVTHHPYLGGLVDARNGNDLKGLDRAAAGSLGLLVSNAVRTSVLALTRGRVIIPPIGGSLGHCFGHFSRLSAAAALIGDVHRWNAPRDVVAQTAFSARMAEILGWLYVGAADLKAFHDAGQPDAQHSIARWAATEALFRVQEGLLNVIDNLPRGPVSLLLRTVIFPPMARLRPPTDAQTRAAAQALIDAEPSRTKLSEDLYEPNSTEPGLGRLESAAKQQSASRTIEQLLLVATESGRIQWEPEATLLERAVAAGVLTARQHQAYEAARGARREVLTHDAFSMPDAG